MADDVLKMELYDVPPSYWTALRADLACIHIAKEGTAGIPQWHILGMFGKRVALCPACRKTMPNRQPDETEVVRAGVEIKN